MKKGRIILLYCCIAAGCNNSDNNQQEKLAADTPVTAAVSEQPATSDCYAMVNANDTVRVQLTIHPDSVHGTMLTQYAGKDKNTGVLAGTMRGDTLFADYTFQSEGLQSVREVAFLRQGDQLLEGFGKVEERSGKMVFADRSTLRFGATGQLTKQPCQ